MIDIESILSEGHFYLRNLVELSILSQFLDSHFRKLILALHILNHRVRVSCGCTFILSLLNEIPIRALAQYLSLHAFYMFPAFKNLFKLISVSQIFLLILVELLEDAIESLKLF